VPHYNDVDYERRERKGRTARRSRPKDRRPGRRSRPELVFAADPDLICQEKIKVTDQQILTICISLAVPFAMLMYSNSRIWEVKETLRTEMVLGFERLSNKVDHLARDVATLQELMSSHLREHHNIK
jgi:hypothetical protein